MNESMPGSGDDPNDFSSAISRVGATAAREYVEHPYWFAIAIVLTAALALPQVVNFSNDALPSTALPSKPPAQPEAVTRSIDPPNQSLPPSAELSARISAPSTEPSAQTSAPSIEPQIQSVKFPNPFDSDEIFEFAPGTSKEDARAAVVEILRERAAGRQSP